MEETIAFKVDVQNDGATKSVQELRKDFSALQKELSNTKEGTKEYYAVLQKLGTVKDDMGDLRAQIQALNPEGKVQAFQGLAGTIASGFQVAGGALAAFGVESDSVEKSLLRLQAISSFTEGVRGLAGFKDQLQIVKAVILQNETVAKAAALAQKLWNAAMNAFPGAQIVAIAGAIIAAGTALYKIVSDNGTAAKQLAKDYEDLKEKNDAITQSIDSQITALSGLKANEKEIIKLKRERLELEKETGRAAIAAAIAKQKEAEESFNFDEAVLKLLGKDREARALNYARTKEEREATNKAIAEQRDSVSKIAQFDNEQKQKSIDKSKEVRDKQKQYEKELQDLRATNIKDEFDRQEQQALLLYQRKKDQYNKEVKDAKLKFQLLAEAETLYFQQLETIEGNRAAKIAEAQQKEIDDNKAKLDKIADDESDYADKIAKEWQAAEDKKREIYLKTLNDRIQAESEQLNNLKSLGDFGVAISYGVAKQKADDELAILKDQLDKKLITEKEYADKSKAINDQLENDKFSSIRAGANAANQLANTVFEIQLNNAKGNAQKTKEIQKKQFQVNKAFGIAGATIDGVQAVQKALNNPYPLNIVLAVLSGALAAANIVKIATTKFDDGGGSSSTPDIGGAPAMPSLPAPPTIQQPGNTTTKLDDKGNNLSNQQPTHIVVENHINEVEVTNSQKRNSRIVSQATFG